MSAGSGAAPATSPAAALRELALRFTEAFNRNDLDEVMSLFAADAVYDEVNGARSRGKPAIRAAFEPQFRGDYGAITFDVEDLFVDVDPSSPASGNHVTGKALVRWECRIESNGKRRAWRGLDVLHLRSGLVVEKHTYGKAERVRIAKSPTSEGGSST
jgi:ketosteroid isomerase-like protein